MDDLRVTRYDDDLAIVLDAAIAINGEPGEDGIGIPPAGLPAQVLAKLSEVDYDVAWQSPTGGLPVDGTTGQVLTKISDAPLDTAWMDAGSGAGSGLPVGGAAGTLLSKVTSTNYDVAWVAPNYAPAVHSHSINDVANLQTELDNKAPLVHTHVSSDITDLPTLLGNKQPLDATLTSFAALTGTDNVINRLPYFNGTDTFATTLLDPFARTLLDDSSNTAMRTTLGLGTSAIINTGTSGATIPLLNAANTWSATQTFGTINASSIQEGGVTLASKYAALVHTHTIADTTGLQAAIDAKVSTSSYTAADVLAKLLTVDGVGSGLDADFLDGISSAGFAAVTHTHAISDTTGLQAALDAKVPTSSYTAADVLAKLLTVDSSGSGLDADLLDAQSGAYYLAWGNLTGVPATFTPSTHIHAIADVTNLQTGLDNKLDDSQLSTDSSFTANSDTLIPSQKATKTYVDTFASGMHYTTAVRVATTVNGTLATAFANGQTVDGVVLATNDRILLKNQTTTSQNGIYVVTAGTPTRATDADAGAELKGIACLVTSGTANAGSQWQCSNATAPVVGTDAVTFVQIASGAVSYTAGTGLTLTGNQFAVSDPELLALLGLTSVADRLPYFTGSGTAALLVFPTYGRSLASAADATTAQTTLGLVPGTNVQGYDATLAALAGLNATAGLVEQTATDAFTKRLIGVANATDIPTRANADARYAAFIHTHVIADTTGLQAALDAKLPSASYTAADVLAKLLTVDGAGSGLDADTLDGMSSAAFQAAGSYQTFDNTLAALAGLDSTAGLVEQTGIDAFTKRLIGVASATDIPTRANADARYAQLSGAAFTGAITVEGSITAGGGSLICNRAGDVADAYVYTSADADQSAGLKIQMGGVAAAGSRWYFGKTVTLESGSNAGSDLHLYAFTDTGGNIGRAFIVTRSSRLVTFDVTPAAPTATAGDNTTKLATTAFVTSALSTAGTTYQPLDTELTAIAALAFTDNNFIVGNGTTWVAEPAATARTSLGLGTMALQNATAVAITGGTWNIASAPNQAFVIRTNAVGETIPFQMANVATATTGNSILMDFSITNQFNLRSVQIGALAKAGSTDNSFVVRTSAMAGVVPTERLIVGRGLYMAGATGTDKLEGTINATALYEQGTLLTAKYGQLAVANTWAAAQTISSANVQQLTVVNTTDTATATWAVLRHARATPTAGDGIATLYYQGNNSTPANVNYGSIGVVATAVTAAAEAGTMSFATMAAGASATRLTISAGVIVGAATGGDKGAGTLNATALYENGTAISTTYVPGTLDTDVTLASNSDTRVASQKATKAYVDTAAVGLHYTTAVRVATTANGTLASAFANGQTVDGVVLATGNRILIKNQTTGSENGIYTVNASGAPTRGTDADAGAEVKGIACLVTAGTTNAGSQWQCSNATIPTLGTDALTFVQIASGSSAYTAGTGLSLTGNQFAISDSELLAIAALTSITDSLAYFTGSGTAALTSFTSAGRALVDDLTAGDQRVTLGLGTAALATTGTSGATVPLLNAANTWSATQTFAAISSSGITEGGVTLASKYQPLHATLTTLATLAPANDTLPYFTGASSATTTPFTAAGRALLDDADNTAQRLTLGLGTAAVAATGTSGATVPLLNAANTWSATQTFAAITSTGISEGGVTLASKYAALAGAAFTAIPTAPTAAPGDSSTKLATTGFVQGEKSRFATNADAIASGYNGSYVVTVDEANAGDEAGGVWYKTASDGATTPGHTHYITISGKKFAYLSRTIRLNTVGKTVYTEIQSRLDELSAKGGGELQIRDTHLVTGRIDPILTADMIIDFGMTGALTTPAATAIHVFALYDTNTSTMCYNNELTFVNPRIDVSAGTGGGSGNLGTAIQVTGFKKLEVHGGSLYAGTGDITMGHGDSALAIVGALETLIDGVSITGFDDCGIYMSGGADAGSPTDDGWSAKITNNFFEYCSNGVSTKRRYRHTLVQNNTFKHCKIGVVSAISEAHPGVRLDILGNFIEKTERYPIDIAWPTKAIIANNRIKDWGYVVPAGTTPSTAVYQRGIWLEGSSEILIEGNTIEMEDWTATTDTTGLYIADADVFGTKNAGKVTSRGNRFKNLGVGINDLSAQDPSIFTNEHFDTVTTKFILDAGSLITYTEQGSGKIRSTGNSPMEFNNGVRSFSTTLTGVATAGGVASFQLPTSDNTYFITIGCDDTGATKPNGTIWARRSTPALAVMSLNTTSNITLTTGIPDGAGTGTALSEPSGNTTLSMATGGVFYISNRSGATRKYSILVQPIG